jgi:hypothetical protein
MPEPEEKKNVSASTVTFVTGFILTRIRRIVQKMQKNPPKFRGPQNRIEACNGCSEEFTPENPLFL